MKWKTFLQIVLLLLIAGGIFYCIYPKYYFKQSTGIGVWRSNKTTGQVEVRKSTGWKTLK